MKMKRALSRQGFFATCIIAAVIFKPASAIWCYQCRSTDHKDPFQCGEYMTSDISIEPLDCKAVYNAQYCVKQTGRFEGGLGTKRFCSSHDLGNYCNYIQQPGDELEYRSCVYTCSTDGCNAANVQQPTVHTFLCSLLFAGFYFSFY
ncbi:U-scoloptoxin(05)-Sm1a [Schistocerca piceifrons]|uniref:U-scoloptoxin(05)-Sm1a n=1 Tax=Schistocerca piceifrons TaxID=274613 RepID=UPI001F5FDBE2|nr:U-scoloptoxin(05)-Sm1a [Schistocerca piceifrons]